MILYPNDQNYIIFDFVDAEKSISDVLGIARKNKDDKKVIWNFKIGNKKIDELKKNTKNRILTHSEATDEMKKEDWRGNEKEFPILQS